MRSYESYAEDTDSCADYFFIKSTQIDDSLLLMLCLFWYTSDFVVSLHAILMLSIRDLVGQEQALTFCTSSASLLMLTRIMYCSTLRETESVRLHLHCVKLKKFSDQLFALADNICAHLNIKLCSLCSSHGRTPRWRRRIRATLATIKTYLSVR